MKYDIAALKRKMLVKYPFFGSVVANVDYKEDKEIPTAGTDGETIYYNPEFLERLSVEEQIFIFVHEVCHIAFNHILRSDGKDQKLWSIATDGVINQFLKSDGLKMAPDGVDIPDAIDYDAEQLYEKLLKEKQQNGQDDSQQTQQGNQQQNQQQSSSGNQGGNNHQQSQSQEQSGGESGKNSQKEDKSKQDVGHDTHSMWEQTVKKHKEQQEKTDKKESLLDKLLGKDKEKTELEKKQEDLESMGEKESFRKNLEDKKRKLEELKVEIAKQASQVGNTSNGDIRTVSDIGIAKPLIDWRYVLRETTKYDVDWSYRNATLENGVVTANLEEQPISETEIVLDTSGSIDEVLLRNFLRECKNILQQSRLKVGCFDTKFYGFHDIRTEKDIENMQFEGGGGTDFDVAVSAFSRRVENKIIFTDGWASMPSTPIDAIWVVFGGRAINPAGGKAIHIDERQLERLCNYQKINEQKGRTR